jgi:hypothetical protein
VFKLFNEEAMMEITSKLSGIILRKAELHGNFDSVYSMVFERMYDIENFEGDEFLFVLGDIGG